MFNDSSIEEEEKAKQTKTKKHHHHIFLIENYCTPPKNQHSLHQDMSDRSPGKQLLLSPQGVCCWE